MKRRLSFLVVIVLTVSILILTGCNSSSKKKTGEKEVIKIGAILPLTGNAADIGNTTKNGIELLFQHYNSDSTLNYSYELDVYDSQSKPSLGKTLMMKIFSLNKKPIIVYSQISGVTLNVQNETEKNKIILIGCVGSDALITDSTKYTYRGFISPQTVGTQIANYVIDSLKSESIGIFYINNTFGESYKRYVEQSCNERNIELEFISTYSEEELNYREIILSNLGKETNVVYLAGVGKSIGLFIKQLREQGYKGWILGDANLPNKSAMNVAGEFMDKVVYLDFNIPHSSLEYKNFVNNYLQTFNSQPDNFSFIAHDGIKIFLDYMNENNISETSEIIDGIENYKTNGILGKISIKESEIIFPLTFKEVIN